MSLAAEVKQGPKLDHCIWQLWSPLTLTKVGWGWGRPKWGFHWKSKSGEPAQMTLARSLALLVAKASGTQGLP